MSEKSVPKQHPADESIGNEPIKSPNIWVVGMAMFSMYFGSGNVTFPVIVGQLAQDKVGFAIVGLLLTAVLVPFLGLMAMGLFGGDYFAFFNRLGKLPAWGIILVIMGLIGPLAMIPRCIVISHSTLHTFFPSLDLTVFSALSCVLIFALSYKRSRILDILGYVLTPILLLSLVAIIIKGLLTPSSLEVNPASNLALFKYGFLEGYNMLDLFASFMFSGVVLSALRRSMGEGVLMRPKLLLATKFRASFVGMGLLALIYVGMCYVSAMHGAEFTGMPADKLLSLLTKKVLGASSGIVVCVAVSFACLTTAISLSMVFSEFISERVLPTKINYRVTLIITLAISLVVSMSRFSGIQGFLVPILFVSLPALIVLTVLNLAYKLAGIETVKLPVLATFLATLWFYLS